MSEGLDVIILDDDSSVCGLIFQIINRFYVWGDIFNFTNVDEAIVYCLNRETGIAIFIIDVFLGEKSGFYFIDAIANKFTSAYEDTIIITGRASDDVVNMCLSADIHYLLEKPIRPYDLQLAVRAIMTKYSKLAGKLLQDPLFAGTAERFIV
jgi:response regulator of citrate/malate metabolism